jgi:anti-anti-sigma factor
MVPHSILDTAVLRHEGPLTIYEARASWMHWMDRLAVSQGLELDLGGVTEIDSAGLQVLMMIKRCGRETGKPVSFIHHSAPVQEVIDLCQLAARFGDPFVISEAAR